MRDRAHRAKPYPIQHVVVASSADGPWWVCGHMYLVRGNRQRSRGMLLASEGKVGRPFLGPHPKGLISGRGVQGPQRVFDPCDLRRVAHIKGLQEGGREDTQTRLYQGQPPTTTGGHRVGRRPREGVTGQGAWQTRTSWKQPFQLAKTCSRPWLSPAQSWGSW